MEKSWKFVSEKGYEPYVTFDIKGFLNSLSTIVVMIFACS